ncbi:MAG: protein phosphatase CheZ [Bdellovibrionales bacterium]|nr:protein phosphatase CheZ [Bdellovibrionales bacterium]
MSSQVPNDGSLQELIESLGSGNAERIEAALLQLGANRESELFLKVGTLARTLHESLKDFQKNLVVGGTDMSSTTLPDAASKLEAVINMTFEAAHQTLELAEAEGQRLQQSKERVEKLEQVIGANRTLPEEEKRALFTHLQEEKKSIEESLQANSELIMAQGFQDLSGQVLRKVIRLVTELETNLVSLVQVFGVEEGETKIIEVEEQQEEVSDGPLDQDDVDSVLKSFGF